MSSAEVASPPPALPVPSPGTLNRILGLLLFWGLAAGIVFTSLGERRVDLWWQLAEGRTILQTHHLPGEPPAAFGLPHASCLDEYGLYEVVLALLDRIGGSSAIHAAFIVVNLLIFAVPLALARRSGPNLLSLALLALAGVFMINRHEQRPEIVGVLLLVLLLALIRQAPRFSFLFPLLVGLLFVAWTNVHSSYLIGLLAVALAAFARCLRGGSPARWRPWQSTLFLATAVGAVLLNPYGWHRVAYTFYEERDLGSNLLSREMWPVGDQPVGVQVLMLITGMVLALALIRGPRRAWWLGTLAVALFALTLFHIRHMSFLAATLLYLGPEQTVPAPRARWAFIRTPILTAGCIALLLFDSVALRNSIHDVVAAPNSRDRIFAPEIVSTLQNEPSSAVLCHDLEGSYLSLTYPPRHFPLIDTGQGRFDDDTKRLYFFLVEDPACLERFLSQWPEGDLLITRPVLPWALLVSRNPSWRLIAIDREGALFRRAASPLSLPSPPRRAELEQAVSTAAREGDFLSAFCLGTVADPLSGDVPMLDRIPVSAWSESLFVYVRAWLEGLPPPSVDRLGRLAPLLTNPLLRELVGVRLHSTAALPPVGASHLEQLARVLTLVDRRDLRGAQDLFNTLPRPLVSPLYYELRDQLDPTALQHASALERWQDWHAGGNELFQRMLPLLQARVHELTRRNAAR